jgi:hypothetical protein
MLQPLNLGAAERHKAGNMLLAVLCARVVKVVFRISSGWMSIAHLLL